MKNRKFTHVLSYDEFLNEAESNDFPENEDDFEPFEEGDEIGYHGRTGIVKEYDGYNYYVYFDDIGDTEAIEAEELHSQNS
jgi:hypothetical protein